MVATSASSCLLSVNMIFLSSRIALFLVEIFTVPFSVSIFSFSELISFSLNFSFYSSNFLIWFVICMYFAAISFKFSFCIVFFLF